MLVVAFYSFLLITLPCRHLFFLFRTLAILGFRFNDNDHESSLSFLSTQKCQEFFRLWLSSVWAREMQHNTVKSAEVG